MSSASFDEAEFGWGAWELSGTNGMRVGVEVIWRAVDYFSTSVTADIYFWTQNRFKYDDNQTLNYSGSLSGSDDYYNNTGATTGTTWDAPRFRKLKTFTFTYSTYGTSPGSRTFGATLSGVANGVTIAYYQYSTDNATWSTTPSNPFNVTGTNGTAVTVYVRAVNNHGIGGFSASTASTPRTVPSAPTSFSANSATFGQVALSWGPPSSNGGAGVTSYVLRNGSTVLQNSTATSYTHTGLAPSTTYSYTVTAVNVAGESASSSVSATTIGGYAKVWNGSSWVTLFPKVWNGSSWAEAQARVWNGSEWKHGI